MEITEQMPSRQVGGDAPDAHENPCWEVRQGGIGTDLMPEVGLGSACG